MDLLTGGAPSEGAQQLLTPIITCDAVRPDRERPLHMDACFSDFCQVLSNVVRVYL